MTLLNTRFAFLLLALSSVSVQGAFRGAKSEEKIHRGLEIKENKFLKRCEKVGLQTEEKTCADIFEECNGDGTCRQLIKDKRKEDSFVPKCIGIGLGEDEDACRDIFEDCYADGPKTCRKQLKAKRKENKKEKRNDYVTSCMDQDNTKTKKQCRKEFKACKDSEVGCTLYPTPAPVV